MGSMQFARVFFLAAIFLGSSCVLPASSLVTGFNVVSLGDFNSSNSDLQGTLAVRGNLTLQNYSLNQSAPMPNTAAGGYDTIVGGDLTFKQGSVYGKVHSTAASFTSASVCSGCSITGSTSPIDFNALASSVNTENIFLYQLTSTGSTTMPYSTLMLAGSGNSALQVFSITAAQLSNNSGIDITNLPSGATVLINVSDTGSHSATTSSAGLQINNVQQQTATNVVFNFDSTITNISIANSFYASMLAPNANVQGTYGAFNGDLVAKNYSGNEQFNRDPFSGTLPTAPAAVPEPASIGLIAGSLFVGFGLFRSRYRHKVN